MTSEKAFLAKVHHLCKSATCNYNSKHVSLETHIARPAVTRWMYMYSMYFSSNKKID